MSQESPTTIPVKEFKVRDGNNNYGYTLKPIDVISPLEVESYSRQSEC